MKRAKFLLVGLLLSVVAGFSGNLSMGQALAAGKYDGFADGLLMTEIGVNIETGESWITLLNNSESSIFIDSVLVAQKGGPAMKLSGYPAEPYFYTYVYGTEQSLGIDEWCGEIEAGRSLRVQLMKFANAPISIIEQHREEIEREYASMGNFSSVASYNELIDGRPYEMTVVVNTFKDAIKKGDANVGKREVVANWLYTDGFARDCRDLFNEAAVNERGVLWCEMAGIVSDEGGVTGRVGAYVLGKGTEMRDEGYCGCGDGVGREENGEDGGLGGEDEAEIGDDENNDELDIEVEDGGEIDKSDSQDVNVDEEYLEFSDVFLSTEREEWKEEKIVAIAISKDIVKKDTSVAANAAGVLGSEHRAAGSNEAVGKDYIKTPVVGKGGLGIFGWILFILAVVASGFVFWFFLIFKRRKDDEEEEDRV
jgi:hypothetical protein